ELHFRFWDFSERIVVNVDVIEEVNGVEPIWIENGFIVVRLRASLDER
ncbi:MAG: hypothetical protein HN356_15245, partial [Calditrichaeota bacterium]|nr:hypothetical protein [Calditrichota bacterium]